MCRRPLEYSSNYFKALCPSCIGYMRYVGHGSYDEEYECYCEEVYEPFADGYPSYVYEEDLI